MYFIVNRPIPEWNVTPPSSSIERLVIRANMERSSRRDLRTKNAKIMIKISPTMATGTAHTAAFRPFFLPVCLPALGATEKDVGTSGVAEVRETKRQSMSKSLQRTSSLGIQALRINWGCHFYWGCLIAYPCCNMGLEVLMLFLRNRDIWEIPNH